MEKITTIGLDLAKSLRSRQYEDLDGAAARILLQNDELEGPESIATQQTEKDR